MADIRGYGKRMVAVFDAVADIIGAVVWNLESGNPEIADRKRNLFFDNSSGVA